jgi:HPt (histidine-containing phosphotransfer) domain-containing protein
MAIEDKTESDAGIPIDWQVARNFTGGDDALLDELLELFPEESEKHLEAIRIAIERGDGPSLARAAHTLKSSARLFGASTLAARALEMETLGQSSSTVEAEARLPDLQTQTSRVIAALKQGRAEG